MISIPSLPLIKEKIEEFKKKAQLSPAYYFPEEMAKNVANFAVDVLRDFPRSIISLGTWATQKLAPELGIEEYHPTGKVEEILLGKEPIKTPPKTGEEILRPFLEEKSAQKWGTAIGTPLAVLGALPILPIGKGVGVSKKIADSLVEKYGEEVAEQIIKKGGKNLAEQALINGNEELVGAVLKRDGIKNILNKIDDAITKMKPIRGQQEKLYSVERSIRAKNLLRVWQDEGEEGYIKALGTLKGELPKIDFEPIKIGLTQPEVDELFNYIRHFPHLPPYQKLNTASGLAKLLSGEIPQTHELRLLKIVFGTDFAEKLSSKMPLWNNIWEAVGDLVNIPRSLMASADMSATLRQGFILSLHKPKIAWGNFLKSFKYFIDKNAFESAMDEITSRPTYGLMREAGVDFTEIGRGIRGLSRREEVFISNLAERIPIIGKIIGASERAYVGFLNKLRADVFDDLADNYIKGGYLPETDPKVFRDLADVVNVFTGRGPMPRSWIVPMNTIFFSPRLQTARLQALNPIWYLRLSPPVRREAMKAMIKFIMTGLGILGLAKLNGAKVEEDPRSSDFGKIRVGNIRWDIWGGFQQWTRFIAQMILGEYKSLKTGEVRKISGKEFPFRSRMDWAFQYARGKFNPIWSLADELMTGYNVFSGEETTPSRVFFEHMVPIYIQDLVTAIQEMGPEWFPAIAIPGFFGVGVQRFGPKEYGPLPDLSGVIKR